MARILINRAASREKRIFDCPLAGKRCRIVNRRPVQNCVRTSARESFHDMQIFRGSPESGLLGEIGGVDYQRVAFPMADRIAKPLADIFWGMRSTEANDAGIVHHLDEDHHVIGSLHDLVVVVVKNGKHGWSGGGPEPE